jgi:hypothetical protein
MSRVGIIDPDGILKACTTKVRMIKNKMNAKTAESIHSRHADF